MMRRRWLVSLRWPQPISRPSALGQGVGRASCVVESLGLVLQASDDALVAGDFAVPTAAAGVVAERGLVLKLAADHEDAPSRIRGRRRECRGEAEHAVNLAGGLHHAMPAAASGFCVYNDGAVAIAELLAAGATRVAYVDLDAHHGDGVQHAFYTDPRVLTISLHETGLTLWPGTGFPGESGAGDARGMSVNVALPGGTGDAGWLRAFTAVVPPLLRAFEPEVLVTQFGCDGHR